MLLAFTLRLLYLLELRHTPLFDSPGLDSAYYLDQARVIAGGDWIGSEVFFMGPLYPYVLACFGSLVGFSPLKLLIVQCLLGSIGPVLLYFLGRRLFDRPTAIVAAVGMATYGMLIQYDNQFLMEWLLTLLMLAVLLQLATVGPRTRIAVVFLGGVLLGLAVLARASLLAFAPSAFLWLGLGGAAGAHGERARGKGADRRKNERSAGKGERARGQGEPGLERRSPAAALRRRWIVAYAAGLAAVIAPVAVRNAIVGKDRVLITSNGGLNLFIGNNPIGRGTYMPLDEVARAAGVSEVNVDVSWMITDPTGRTVAEAALGRPLRPSEISAFYARRAFDYMVSNPSRALLVLGRKLLLFWNATEIGQVEDPALYRELIAIARAPLLGFGTAGPLALLGLVWVLAPERRRRLLILPLFVFTFMLTVVAFFVTARYRTPVVPVLILLAAFAVMELVRRGRATARARTTGRSGRASAWLRAYARPALLLAGFAAVVHLNLVQTNPAGGYISLGIALAGEGRHEEAIRVFTRAVDAAPRDPVTRYNLGAAYLKAGRYSDAVGTFERVVTLAPRSVVGWGGMGESLARLGRAPEAAQAFRQAATLAGRDPTLWGRLGETELDAGRPDSALAALQRALALDPKNPAILQLINKIEEGERTNQ
jgi:tetratricopeptide (TPR) repeat protein